MLVINFIKKYDFCLCECILFNGKIGGISTISYVVLCKNGHFSDTKFVFLNHLKRLSYFSARKSSYSNKFWASFFFLMTYDWNSWRFGWMVEIHAWKKVFNRFSCCSHFCCHFFWVTFMTSNFPLYECISINEVWLLENLFTVLLLFKVILFSSFVVLIVVILVTALISLVWLTVFGEYILSWDLSASVKVFFFIRWSSEFKCLCIIPYFWNVHKQSVSGQVYIVIFSLLISKS